jgi:hypothetical protein
MTLDLLIAITASASAAIVIAALALSTPASAAQRIGMATVLTAWFAVAVALAATGAVSPAGLGTLGLGIAVLLPIVAIAFLTPRLKILRSALYGIPLSVLIGVNALRIFGYFFIIHYDAGRLPAPFAPSAGWGDVLAGIFAIPVAILVARKAIGWRPIAFVWALFAITDLILAIGFGVTSAYDSPLRIFTGGPDTVMMAELPMFLIPGFLVPVFILTHIAVFVRLMWAENGARNGSSARMASI